MVNIIFNLHPVLYCGPSIPGGQGGIQWNPGGIPVDSSKFQSIPGGFQWIPGGFRWTLVDSVGIQHIPGGFQVDCIEQKLELVFQGYFRWTGSLAK